MDGPAFTGAFIITCIIFGGGTAGIAHDYGKRPIMLTMPALLCIGGGLAVISCVVTQPASSWCIEASTAAMVMPVNRAHADAPAHFLRSR